SAFSDSIFSGMISEGITRQELCKRRDGGQNYCTSLELGAPKNAQCITPGLHQLRVTGAGQAEACFGLRNIWWRRRESNPRPKMLLVKRTTCLVVFMPQALPWDVRGARSEPTRNAFR